MTTSHVTCSLSTHFLSTDTELFVAFELITTIVLVVAHCSLLNVTGTVVFVPTYTGDLQLP